MRRKGRWLFNFAAGVSLLLCAITLAAHCVGGFADPNPMFRQLVGRWVYLFDGSSAPGGRLVIQLIFIHHAQSPIVGPVIPMGSSPQLNAWHKRFPTRVRYFGTNIGFSYGPSLGTDSARRLSMDGTRIHLILAYWIIELLLLILPVVAWRPRFVRRKSADVNAIPCPQCGYDLRATPDRCPECGMVPAAASLSKSEVRSSKSETRFK